jgi:hypothetical protein
MMTYLKNFLLFWYDFIVGDDWMIAAGVVMALVLSAALARRGLNAWWVMLVPSLSCWRPRSGGRRAGRDRAAPLSAAPSDITGARWRCATRETAPVSGYEYQCHTAVLTDVCTVV